MVLLGVLLNVLVAWSMLLIPRVSAPADLQMAQIRDPHTDRPYRAVYSATYQWIGVHERQLYLTPRARPRPLPKRTGVYWTWLPLDTPANPLDRTTTLFAEFAPPQPDWTVISTIRVGFPALALGCDTLVEDFALQPDGTLKTDARAGFLSRVDGAAGNPRPIVWPHARSTLVPYRPIWIGFVINSIFYTLLVLIAFWVHRQIRHARRMRRGRCPWCGYELHHDFRDGCPECGWRRSPPQSTP